MSVKKFLLVIIVLGNVVLSGFAQEKVFPVPTGNSKQLFYLQRTSNTNTIVYELNQNSNKLDADNPVQGHWIRYQEKGQIQDLSYIQKKFAYGIKSKKIAENHYELSFVSYKKYKMYLRQGVDKNFYVFISINQKSAILTSIFVKINGGSFWSPNVEYVEITGLDPITRSVMKERLKI